MIKNILPSFFTVEIGPFQSAFQLLSFPFQTAYLSLFSPFPLKCPRDNVVQQQMIRGLFN